MATFHNVERITRTGRALYLMHVPGIGMEWSVNAEDALRYDDIDDAQADALAHGGEVSSFYAPDWRPSESARSGVIAMSRLIFDPWTGKPVDKVSGLLPSLAGFECDECGAEVINRCIRCGAPVCCPRCCFEDSQDRLRSINSTMCR